jgi:hypothetical protein
MFKKMSGKQLTKDQMEKLSVLGGQLIIITIEPYDPCKEFCNSRCGEKCNSDKDHLSGQDFYQN